MIWKMYKKEMTDALRDRRTLLLTAFLPILMLSGLVFFYESLLVPNTHESYTIAVPAALDKQESKIFSDQLHFTVFPDPKEAVNQGHAKAALIFDGSLNGLDHGNKKLTATIYGDSLSQDASAAMTQLTSDLERYKEEIVAQKLSSKDIDKDVLNPIQINKEELSSNKGNAASITALSIFLPMMIALSIAIGGLPAASDMFAGEKERQTMEALLMSPVSRGKILTAKWLAISTMGVISGFIAVAVTVVEIMFLTEFLKLAFNNNDQIPVIIGASIIMITLFALLIGAVLMVISIIAKSVKETQSYSSPIMILPVLPVLFLSSVGVNELSITYFMTPVVNLYALIKEMLYGIVDIPHMLITFGTTGLCVIIALLLSRILFLKDKWILSK